MRDTCLWVDGEVPHAAAAVNGTGHVDAPAEYHAVALRVEVAAAPGHRQRDVVLDLAKGGREEPWGLGVNPPPSLRLPLRFDSSLVDGEVPYLACIGAKGRGVESPSETRSRAESSGALAPYAPRGGCAESSAC